MNKKILSTIIFLSCWSFLYSQNDCQDAIVICGNSNFENLNASGVGTQELSSANSCSGRENNSLWFKININQGGTLGFTLTPTTANGQHDTNIQIDFDFFVFGPNTDCNNLGHAIRCSTTNPSNANQGNNLTGMNSSSTDVSEGPGADGDSFVKQLDVLAGESYFIVIDRPHGDSNFKIDWTGTATFNPPPTINTPPPSIGNSYDIKNCDADGTMDGFTNFDLTQNTPHIQGSQTDVSIEYFRNNTDAQTNRNSITNPSNFINTSNPQTIFARITNQNTLCFSTTSFQLIVNNTIQINQATDYFLCDDIDSGSDEDGLNSNFILSTKDSEILQGIANNASINISYHKSLTGAENNTEIIDKNNPYKNETPNSQQIFIRASNSEGCTNFSRSFYLQVSPVPILNNNITYEQCDVDDNPIDGFTSFNLNTKINDLINITDQILLEFFETTDVNFTTPISNTTNYTNLSAFNHTLKVKATNTETECYQIKNLQLKVSPTSLANYTAMYACEIDENANDSDAIKSNGSGTASFNFNEKTTTIINQSNNVFSNDTHLFQYYSTKQDAILQENEIIAPFSNYRFETNTIIYVRITEKLSNDCEGIGQFNLIITPLPIPQGNENTLYLCVIQNQQNFITLNASTGNTSDEYQWFLNGNSIPNATEATYNATSTGTYKVEAYRNHPQNNSSCMGYNTFYVEESSKAVIENLVLNDDNDNPIDNSILVEVSGKGSYEYALNTTGNNNYVIGDDNFSYLFTQIEASPTFVFIRDKNGCGITQSEELFPIYFQRHFSPNGDNIFDTWKILGTSTRFFPIIKIEIFDRFGKLLTTLNQENSEGWNGKLNSKPLTPNDYWYHALLIDINGNVRKKTGHFSLIR